MSKQIKLSLTVHGWNSIDRQCCENIAGWVNFLFEWECQADSIQRWEGHTQLPAISYSIKGGAATEH